MELIGPVSSPGLRETNFTKIADNGFGDGLNSYAHSMAWFQDHLYVGTTRANLCMIKAHNPPSLRSWPTKCLDDVYDLDLRAQIWRYNPRAKDWQRVFISPLVAARDGKKVPRELGYRGMAVFQGPSDAVPGLYVSTWSAYRATRPPLIMRSNGNSKFITVSKLGNDPTINSYRILLPFNGSLYTSPTGKARGKQNVSESPTVLECSDPASEAWHPISAPGFGDPTNRTVFEIAAFNGFLYAGTLNPVYGFQVWKTRLVGNPPYKWIKVIEAGAYRGNLNEVAISMCVFNNALYVGTGIQHGGYDRTYKIGPEAAELIRIHPDDTWDLVVGEPRLTPRGFKFPLSGFGPGFGDFFNAYIWRLAVHQGWLYAGTYNWSIWLPYLSFDRWPTWIRTLIRRVGIDNIIKSYGGFDLWRSRDGTNWIPVTRTGFSNPYNYGARTMISTPFGLFVGSANPFGPEVAVETGTGWRYLPNPNGGLEVWLGTSGQQVKKDGITITTCHPRLAGSRLSGLRSTDQMISNINQRYDSVMYDNLADEYYGYSDFHNFGYWDKGTRNQKEACENLMEKLLSFIRRRKGHILDIACGKGATTRYLLKYYKPSEVTGINISEKQLETCKAKTLHCTFLLMNATQLAFEDESFDDVICVESAFHFNTRADFLREAWRVLKPGGRLVLSDILFKAEEIEGLSPYRIASNYVRDLKGYESLYRRAGFEDVEIINATNECQAQFSKHCRRFLHDKFLAAEVDWRTLIKTRFSLFLSDVAINYYVLVGARKPDVCVN
jgi:ubiquinone/menaquinone biosynthesis C-methylase UbiE